MAHREKYEPKMTTSKSRIDINIKLEAIRLYNNNTDLRDISALLAIKRETIRYWIKKDKENLISNSCLKKYNKVSNSEKQEAVQMRKNGMTFVSIGAMLNVNPKTVQTWMNKPEFNNSHSQFIDRDVETKETISFNKLPKYLTDNNRVEMKEGKENLISTNRSKKYNKVSNSAKQDAVQMRKNGMTFVSIGAMLNVNPKTVQTWINKPEFNNSHSQFIDRDVETKETISFNKLPKYLTDNSQVEMNSVSEEISEIEFTDEEIEKMESISFSELPNYLMQIKH